MKKKKDSPYGHIYAIGASFLSFALRCFDDAVLHIDRQGGAIEDEIPLVQRGHGVAETLEVQGPPNADYGPADLYY